MILIIGLPLITTITIYLIGRNLGVKGVITVILTNLGISIIMGYTVLYNLLKEGIDKYYKININNWIETGLLRSNYEIIYDKYSLIMTTLITTISCIVIIYSIWYMKGDKSIIRFINYLLTFTIAMLILVSSSNLIVMFIGWEGVGIMSYLLVNFWFTIISANKSAIQAVLYNRFGDVFFVLGALLLIKTTGSSNIINMGIIKENINSDILNIIIIFLLIGAIAKSAQIVFHSWLASAMAGPTPVSALLHSSTMVTAGVYLIIRLNSLIEESSITSKIIIIIASITIIFGGISGYNQNDIKKIIAFSTCSQLGYMLLSSGLIAPNNSFYHLYTHGFFKALLFLSAGIIIHLCLDIQDIRKMGSLIINYPITYIFFLVGSLAITSFPYLSGFYSKELIIELSTKYPNIWILTVLGALLTTLYSMKILNLTFYNKPNYTKSWLFNNVNTPINTNTELNKNKNIGEIVVKETNKELEYKYVFFLTILIMGAIFIGYITKNIFINLNTGINILSNLDVEFNLKNSIKVLPLILTLITIILIILRKNTVKLPNKYNIYLLTTFNKRLFLEQIINYLSSKIVKIGYSHTFKNIDRGILEQLGPIGGYRLLNEKKWVSFKLSSDYRTTNNNLLPYNLFIYLFISLSILLYFFFLN